MDNILAIVIGTLAGIAAAIPTSLLLLVAITRHEQRQRPEGAYPQMTHDPQSHPGIVIIQRDNLARPHRQLEDRRWD